MSLPQRIESPPRSLEDRLRDGPGEWVALEEFTPLSRCLEWRLANLYWNTKGPTAFFGGDVPYAAINDGRLSADAAKLLVEIHRQSPPKNIHVLEVGGGSGLFAKLFLDELRLLSPELYDVTTYFWTDASPEMVRRTSEGILFAEHRNRVQARVLAVPDMSGFAAEVKDGFDLVIANYLLDNLPATNLRLSHNLVEELEVRTTLDAKLDRSRLNGLTAQEWSQRSLTSNGTDPGLVELYPWFSLECRYRTVSREAFPFATVIPNPAEGKRVSWMHQEILWRWLKELLPLIRPGGGLLANDYGNYPTQNPGKIALTQHFGGSMANGINFEELSALPKIAPDWAMVSPETDARQLQSRWIGRRWEDLSAGIFRLIFDGERRNLPMELLAQAGEKAQRGFTEDARWHFKEAHRHAPRCWHVMERWAAFHLTRLQDWETTRDLAEEGLKLHPHHPPLWNLKGDALFELNRFTEAEVCYRRAIEINPREVRGRMNLAYAHLQSGKLHEALAAIAEALGLDQEGEYREKLLEKQRQILLRMSVDARDQLSQQVNRFRNLDAAD